jgi:acyl-CoA reductase-like NAD-dependent aldehyde dehydrogenase
MKIAEAITNDMGKTIKESVGEVEKSMTMIDYYVKNTLEFAANEKIPPSRFSEVIIMNQPLGTTLCKVK